MNLTSCSLKILAEYLEAKIYRSIFPALVALILSASTNFCLPCSGQSNWLECRELAKREEYDQNYQAAEKLYARALAGLPDSAFDSKIPLMCARAGCLLDLERFADCFKQVDQILALDVSLKKKNVTLKPETLDSLFFLAEALENHKPFKLGAKELLAIDTTCATKARQIYLTYFPAGYNLAKEVRYCRVYAANNKMNEGLVELERFKRSNKLSPDETVEIDRFIAAAALRTGDGKRWQAVEAKLMQKHGGKRYLVARDLAKYNLWSANYDFGLAAIDAGIAAAKADKSLSELERVKLIDELVVFKIRYYADQGDFEKRFAGSRERYLALKAYGKALPTQYQEALDKYAELLRMTGRKAEADKLVPSAGASRARLVDGASFFLTEKDKAELSRHENLQKH